MQNQKEILGCLNKAILAIAEADNLTHAENGSMVEPQWWLDMMDAQRKLHEAKRAVEKRNEVNEKLLQDAINALAAFNSYVDVSTVGRAKTVRETWANMGKNAKEVLKRAEKSGVEITDLPGRF